jgi:branched-subunit amino acid transport protein
MTLWIAIFAVAAGSFLIKAAGPAALGNRTLPDWCTAVLALLAPALLAALVVVEVLGRRGDDLDWTVLAGLATATGMWLLRTPMLAAVLAGVVVTALLRLVTG